MDAYAVLERYSQHPVGIGFAEVVLADKGQFVQVRDALDVVRCDAFFFHQLAIIRHMVPDVPDLFDQLLFQLIVQNYVVYT